MSEQPCFTRDQVSTAANRAADWLRDQQEYECEETIRQQSYGDLVVNLALHWLEHPGDTAEQAIEQSYSEPTAEVLSWAGLSEYREESEEDETAAEEPRTCAVCDGPLELSDQYPEAGYLHSENADDAHGTPVLKEKEENSP
jgi:hypothetical protein